MPCFEDAWVAVNVRGLREKIVAERLLGNGYECFLPLQTTRAGFSLNHEITKPLFPGYLFCRYKMQHKFRIVQTPGVLSVVGFGGIPAVIPEEEIASIHKIVHSKFYPEPHEFLPKGQRVRIDSGPLKGVEGIVASGILPKVVVNVEVLKRAIAVTVLDSVLTPIETRELGLNFSLPTIPAFTAIYQLMLDGLHL
jgi:transcription antitermination factor NusG